jgi:Protein of unknown function (DUF4019)
MNIIFALALLIALPLSAASTEDLVKPTNSIVADEKPSPEKKWEPSEQDQLKIKLLSYQYLQAKDNGEFDAAFSAMAENTKSAIDFKKWKYNIVLFNATAGAKIDRTFNRISWYENPAKDPASGIFSIVNYSGMFTNVDIQCGILIWHKKTDGNFELIREQENYLDKASQEKLSVSEITHIKAKFACIVP